MLRSVNPSKKVLFLIIIVSLLLLSCNFMTDLFAGKPDIYFPMMSEDGQGIMDCSGEWVVEPLARDSGMIAGPMIDGLAPFYNPGFLDLTYINQAGEFPFDKNFDEARPFSEGLAAVKVDDMWGFIDTSGELVIQPRFLSSEIGNFNVGLANVVDEVAEIGIPTSWIFINEKGEEVLGPYRRASYFSDGYAAVSGVAGDKISGFINTKGEFVLSFTLEDGYTPAGNYSGGLFPVSDLNKMVKDGDCPIGFMNKKGEWVIEPEFCRVGDFNDGLASVSRSKNPAEMGSYGYINTTGKMVIAEKYDFESTFSGGCARVGWDGMRGFGLIDTQGKIIHQYEPDR